MAHTDVHWTDATEVVVDATKPRGERFRGDGKNVALIILRSKNQNVVCYEALDEAKALADAGSAVTGFWMDVDPAYMTPESRRPWSHVL